VALSTAETAATAAAGLALILDASHVSRYPTCLTRATPSVVEGDPPTIRQLPPRMSIQARLDFRRLWRGYVSAQLLAGARREDPKSSAASPTGYPANRTGAFPPPHKRLFVSLLPAPRPCRLDMSSSANGAGGAALACCAFVVPRKIERTLGRSLAVEHLLDIANTRRLQPALYSGECPSSGTLITPARAFASSRPECAGSPVATVDFGKPAVLAHASRNVELLPLSGNGQAPP